MDNNVYKPPESNVLIEEQDANKFYVVSPKKFYILFIATFGLYQLYWFYKNWELYKKTGNYNLWPIPRAIFSIFFTHALFRYVNKELEEKQIKSNWSHATTATLYVIITIFSNLSDRILEKTVGEVVSGIILMLTIPVTAWILFQAQMRINLACGSSKGEENSILTLANYAWIFVGLSLWLLFALMIFVLIYPESLNGVINTLIDN